MENEILEQGTENQELEGNLEQGGQPPEGQAPGGASGEEGVPQEGDGEQQEAGATGEPPAELPAEQDPETRRRFAEMRREQEMFRRLLGDTINPATGKPFETVQEFGGWKEAQRRERAAQQAGVSAEVIAQLEQAAAQRVKETDPEILAQRQLVEQYQAEKQAQVFERDLAEIRKAYPDEQAKKVDELGEEFLAIMASGRVTALAAYEAVRAAKKRTAPPPPSMGDLGHTAGAAKDFFSREEVAKMTAEEVGRNFEAIRTSQAKW